MLEGIGAIENENVEVNFEIESRSVALARIVPTILLHFHHPWQSNEGDNPRSGAPAGTQARSSYDSAGQRPCHNPQDLGFSQSGRAANSRRSGQGKDITHWRMETRDSMLPTRWAAVSTIRRTPREGQNPRSLQLNGTKCSYR